MSKDTAGNTVAKPVSAFSLFTQSKDIVQKNLQQYAILYAPTIIMTLYSLRNPLETNASGTVTLGGPTAVSALLFAVLVVASLVAQIMLTSLTLRNAKGKSGTFDELWSDTKKFTFPIIGMAIVVGLMFLVGLLLLIIPAFIVLRRYFLAAYVMLDQDLGIGQSMKKSAAISKPFSGSIWGLLGVSLLINLPSALGVIGSLVTLALTFAYAVAPALRYVELKKLTANAAE